MVRAHPSLSELEAFDRGLLRPTEWAEIERHVAECDSCCRILEDAPDDTLVTLLKASGGQLRSLTTPDSPVRATPVVRTAGAPKGSGEPPPELADHPRYRILERLGAGGMGTVFKAEHRLMCRIVALKVLHADLLRMPGGVGGFHQEVRAAALLSHPNIATAYDADRAGDTHFLVMEFVEGQSLDRVLEQRGPLPWPEACDLIRQVALGLQHAFERGMVHRDLKPANLLLTPQGQAKILDFGLARLSSESPQSTGRLTPVGAVVGTPQYLAPEQAREPQAADIRADLYSLGCTWYELLTGQTVFPRGTLLQQLLAHQDQPVRPLTDFRSDVPTPLCQVLQRLLEKDPAKRWETPAELLKALEPWTHPADPPAPLSATRVRGRRTAHRMALRVTVGALLLVLLVWTGWNWLASAPRPQDEGQAKDTLETVAQAKPSAEPDTSAEKGPDAPQAKDTDKPGSARDRAIAWLAANNRFGPERPLVQDSARKLNHSAATGKVFVLEVSPALLKSAQPTLLVGRQQDFFVFEVPPGTLPVAGFQTILYTSAEQNQEFQTPLSVHLSDLRIEQQEIDGTLISGSVAYRAAAPVSGRLAVRLTLLLGTRRTVTSYSFLNTKDIRGEGTLSFRFRSLYTEQTRPDGLIVLLIDLSAVDQCVPPVKALVLSNDLAALVVAQKPTMPTP